MTSLRFRKFFSRVIAAGYTLALLVFSLIVTMPNISAAAPPEVIFKSDLPSGIEWVRTDLNSWHGTRQIKPDMQIGKAGNFDSFFIDAFIQVGESRATPEEWRKSFKGAGAEYPRLPGGVLVQVYPETSIRAGEAAWLIHFWKSGAQGSVRVWTRCDSSYYAKNTLAARSARNREFALSECKRLAELVWSRLPEAKTAAISQGSGPVVKKTVEPIVVIVHGIGFGETRSAGWSKLMSQSWGLSPLFEVTHNPADIPDSFNWIKTVRQRFEDILARSRREKRPVIIVSHSWGSVMSKLALNGGRIEDGSQRVLVVNPMQEQGWVDQWITLGSPLQIDGQYKYFGMPTVTYGANKPSQVKRWSNFYDVEDIIGLSSRSLVDIPMNVGLQANKAAFSWYLAKSGIDPGFEQWTQKQRNQNAGKFNTAQGLKIAWPHIGIWYHPTVRNFIRNQYAALKQDAEAALSNKTN